MSQGGCPLIAKQGGHPHVARQRRHLCSEASQGGHSCSFSSQKRLCLRSTSAITLVCKNGSNMKWTENIWIMYHCDQQSNAPGLRGHGMNSRAAILELIFLIIYSDNHVAVVCPQPYSNYNPQWVKQCMLWLLTCHTH